MWQTFKPYTNNINEFQYLLKFAYPKYINKFYEKKIVLEKEHDVNNKEDKEAKNRNN